MTVSESRRTMGPVLACFSFPTAATAVPRFTSSDWLTVQTSSGSTHGSSTSPCSAPRLTAPGTSESSLPTAMTSIPRGATRCCAFFQARAAAPQTGPTRAMRRPRPQARPDHGHPDEGVHSRAAAIARTGSTAASAESRCGRRSTSNRAQLGPRRCMGTACTERRALTGGQSVVAVPRRDLAHLPVVLGKVGQPSHPVSGADNRRCPTTDPLRARGSGELRDVEQAM